MLFLLSDEEDCFPDTCKFGGNCTDKVNDFHCDCKPGYNGKSCENGTISL